MPSPMKECFILGMMSGTSVDGVDAVILRFYRDRDTDAEIDDDFEVVAQSYTPFSTSLRKKINAVAQTKSSTRIIVPELDATLAQFYAKVSLRLIEQARLTKSDIALIANHGQTVQHEPNARPGFSVQLGCAKIIADITDILVVNNFRQKDIALGGQGAPLMPAFHSALLSKQENIQYVLNLGGIANITQLGESILGFDTGPANTLLDQWIEHCQSKPFDESGLWAEQGNCIDTILSILLEDDFFQLNPPKSTGPDYFNLSWLSSRLRDNVRTKPLEQYLAVDIQATLLHLSVRSVVLMMEKIHTHPEPALLYVVGGGVKNKAMIRLLCQQLPWCEMRPLQTKKGMLLDADYVEAIGFAWLGYCYLHQLNSNTPSVTGASQSVVLGEGKCAR